MTASPPSTIRVLVCDDHAVFRRGLGMVLETTDGVEVVGEAADTAEAVAASQELTPDVVLMDLRMPGGGGIEAIRQISGSSPSVRFIVLTVSDEDQDLFDAVKAGAVGYLLKEVSIEEVGEAVLAVAAGESLLSPAMTAKLLGGYADLAKQGSVRTAGPIGDLTHRETEALRGIARGLSNRAIAAELGIAENTVKNHVRGVLEKLHVSSRTEAALLAVREGLTDNA